MGLDVKSVNALNKIMEKMGLLIHYGNDQGTTDVGARFSMWHKGVLNSDSWHPELVYEIVKFLKNKQLKNASWLALKPAVRHLCVYAYLFTLTLSPDFNSTVQWSSHIVICFSQRFTRASSNTVRSEGWSLMKSCNSLQLLITLYSVH